MKKRPTIHVGFIFTAYNRNKRAPGRPGPLARDNVFIHAPTNRSTRHVHGRPPPAAPEEVAGRAAVMNGNLKKIVGLIIFAVIVHGGNPRAESAGAPSNGIAKATEGRCRQPRAVSQLTDGEKKRVAAILSSYKAADLTAADARAINEAFRDAGLRRGVGLRDAIAAAGFDPERISALYPPPGSGKPGGKPIRRPGAPPQTK